VTGHEAAAAAAPAFLFATCQVGAEGALKHEILRDWPAFRFAYSRPGFLTFKLPSEAPPDEPFDVHSVFARAWGFSLGKLTAQHVDERAQGVWRLAGAARYDALHVWQRDMARPGWRGFEPHVTPAALQAELAIRRHWPEGQGVAPAPHARIAEPGHRVLDCVLVEPDEWWVGWHRADRGESRFPGGLREIALPPHAVSRAWLKMTEALAWAALPMTPAQRIVELGCAPGGASQALLEHGLLVTGIDPAEVDPRVLAHPHFTHIRKRADDVRRREFRGVAWLAADMNVAPDTMLDTVESIVTHPQVTIRGLLLTVKLLEWKLAANIPAYLSRIQSWGYDAARARQLAHNRQEVCVAALRSEAAQRRRARAAKRVRAKRRR
jgi:23S rRNA (cytidine2498-2'-O)-methyltransferase